MSDPVVVDVFVEDRAHEEFLNPLLHRIAREESVVVTVRVRSARGGHGRAVGEFELYQALVEKGVAPEPPPDLVVVGIDGNCTTVAKKKKEIQEATRTGFSGIVIAACPDPHVERWYLADPTTFNDVVGHMPTLGKKKCTRGHYKDLLAKAVRQAGHPSTLGGVEFARDIVEGLDWYRAGKNDASLRAFLSDLRSCLRQTHQTKSSSLGAGR